MQIARFENGNGNAVKREFTELYRALHETREITALVKKDGEGWKTRYTSVVSVVFEEAGFVVTAHGEPVSQNRSAELAVLDFVRCVFDAEGRDDA